MFNQFESVRFDLNNGQKTQIENLEPYALFGDSDSGFHGGDIPLGNNTIELEFYAQDRAKGELLKTAALDFTLVDDLSGEPLQVGLYDAETDSLLQVLQDGDTLQASSLPSQDNLTIAATVLDNSPFADQVESIRFDLNNGQITKIENLEPYAIFGDTNGDLNGGGGILLGDNTLDFELYSKNKAKGELLDTVKLNFTVV